MSWVLLGLLLPAAPAAAGLHGGEADSCDCSYAKLRPRQYVAYKTAGLNPESLDGDLSKPAWAEVPWTDDFVDIATSTVPQFRTRAKLRWDDQHLYVAAELEDTHIWGTLKVDDTVIYQDNDFEVFVDPIGSTHFYKEFEMNTLNSRWSLCLNKPYSDGGYENSTRVLPGKGWSMLPRTRSAVRVYPEAALNNPSVEGQKWSVEIAFPLAGLIENSTDALPTHGSFWRLDFSRVQWNVDVDAATGMFVKRPSCQSCGKPGSAAEDNWVWSPMRQVNMHAPELWGVVQFSEGAAGGTPIADYDRWPCEAAAMAVYYAQKAYAAAHRVFTGDVHKLLPYSSPPFELCQDAEVAIDLDSAGSSYLATVRLPQRSPWRATIASDRLLKFFPDQAPSDSTGDVQVIGEALLPKPIEV